MRLGSCLAFVTSFLAVLTGQAEMTRAQGEATPPTSHSLYVSVEEAAQDGAARAAFGAAVAKFGLGPVETVDLPDAPPPQAAKHLAAGILRFKDLAFAEAQSLTLAGLDEANATGALGLTQGNLCDLHLYQAMALDHADWHDLPEGDLPAPPPAAWQAYLRSAALCPTRQLYQRTFPPLAIARYTAALAENKRRGEGTLVIRAASDALIYVDGRGGAQAPLSLALPYGEHLVRVERPGRSPWVNLLPLALTRLEVDAPDTAFRTFADASAADHARRMNAAYALVAELKPGTPTLLELRLVQVSNAQRIDSTRVPMDGEVGGIYAAVMRLDEQARRRELLTQQGHTPVDGQAPALLIAPAPTKAARPAQDPTKDPAGWAQTRWPLLVAVGAVLTTSLVLGLAVALDDKMAVQ